MQRYGVKVGQQYAPACKGRDAPAELEVIDDTTYAFCDDVVVRPIGTRKGEPYRIDTFKLACVRYFLKS